MQFPHPFVVDLERFPHSALCLQPPTIKVYVRCHLVSLSLPIASETNIERAEPLGRSVPENLDNLGGSYCNIACINLKKFPMKDRDSSVAI
jgi:hypothetical protein